MTYNVPININVNINLSRPARLALSEDIVDWLGANREANRRSIRPDS